MDLGLACGVASAASAKPAADRKSSKPAPVFASVSKPGRARWRPMAAARAPWASSSGPIAAARGARGPSAARTPRPDLATMSERAPVVSDKITGGVSRSSSWMPRRHAAT